MAKTAMLFANFVSFAYSHSHRRSQNTPCLFPFCGMPMGKLESRIPTPDADLTLKWVTGADLMCLTLFLF